MVSTIKGHDEDGRIMYISRIKESSHIHAQHARLAGSRAAHGSRCRTRSVCDVGLILQCKYHAMGKVYRCRRC